jgi:cobalt-zinc-cadmium efflux system outer membrane protein
MLHYYGLLSILMLSSMMAHSQNSLTLQQSLALAYKNNPSLQAQMALVDQKKGVLIQSGLYRN